MNMRRFIRVTVIICAFIISSMTAIAETDVEGHIREVGLSVKWIEPGIEYKNIGPNYSYSEGLRTIHVTMDRHSKHGAIDETGEVAIPVIYDEMGWFSEGLCYVVSGNKKMYIDSTGKETIDVSQYDYGQPFYFGMAVVEKNQKLGIINKFGSEILSCVYNSVEIKKSGLIWAGNGEEYSLFDSAGRRMAEMMYSQIELDNSTELLAVCSAESGKWGIISKKGEEVLPFEYARSVICSEDIVAARGTDGFGLYDAEGKSISTLRFDSVGTFHEGLASVMINDKYGYIDIRGEIVIPCEYDSASDFYKGLAEVGQIVAGDYRYHPIDKTGQRINIGDKDYYVSTRGDALIGQHNPLDSTIEEPIYVKPLFMEALLDYDGNRLTGFSYTNISEFEGDLAVAYQYDSSVCGLINRHGTEVLPLIFDSIEIIDDRTCLVSIFDYDNGTNKMGILALPSDAATRKPLTPRPITVYLDGLDLYFDTDPTLVNGRTMVPMRKIFETLGVDVAWDDKGRKVTAVKGENSVELIIGSDTAVINGKHVKLDAPATIEQERTLVPLRFVAETLNCDVHWEPESRRVFITTAEN